MSLDRCRIDRFISQQLNINRKNVRLILAQKRITVDGMIIRDADLVIDTFSHIVLDEQILQANTPYYVMLHKPIGVICATKDPQHKTVLDLLTTIDEEIKKQLHIVGRLDLNTSGLVLLTNDSRWSEALTSPEKKVPKCYTVTLENEITSDYIEAFAQGMYFDFEKITTLPAKLAITSAYVADVTLFEGKYHQIKRMFGRFRNPVIALHRYAIGGLLLDNKLNIGDYRMLNQSEIKDIFEAS